MSSTTTLPLPPAATLLIALALVTGLLYSALSHFLKSQNYRKSALIWLTPLALTWLGIFLLSISTAYYGAWRFLNGASNLGFGLGGLIAALLGAPFLIWGTILKTQTVRYQKEGHMTDRISKAVEQLGEEKTVRKDGVETTLPNIEVRIGAILSLERIAQDSTTHDKGRDHVRVMEILCAYIRENAPASEAQDHPYGEWEPLGDDPTDEERAAHEAKRKERFGDKPLRSLVYRWAQTLPSPREDITMVLNVIKRRTTAQRRVEAAWPSPPTEATHIAFDRPCPRLPARQGETSLGKTTEHTFLASLSNWRMRLWNAPGYRLDLRNCNLQGADLSAAEFSGSKLSGARIEGADLSEARMEGAMLIKARVEGTRLEGVWMDGAEFDGARMEGAYLTNARMEGAKLSSVRLEGACLQNAQINGAHLRGAKMERAFFFKAQMQRANLNHARMEGANLSYTQLEGADLSDARMEGAYLSLARMEGADLSNARMEGAVFRGRSLETCKNLEQSQLDQCFGDASVLLPDHLKRPDHWPDWELPDGAPNDEPSFHSELKKWHDNPATYTPPPNPNT